MSRRLLTLPTAALSALLLAACGSSATESADAPAAPAAGEAQAEVQEAPAPKAKRAPAKGPSLPAVSVQDLAGGSVNVADLAGGDKPVLVWFWAPHCPYCNDEAKNVEAFAKAHRDTVEVVGLGTQDSVEEAQAFVAEHGLRTPRMLYDPSSASWQQLGIRGQPAAMLFDRDGIARGQWFGPFDEDEVLDIAGAV